MDMYTTMYIVTALCTNIACFFFGVLYGRESISKAKRRQTPRNCRNDDI